MSPVSILSFPCGSFSLPLISVFLFLHVCLQIFVCLYLLQLPFPSTWIVIVHLASLLLSRHLQFHLLLSILRSMHVCHLVMSQESMLSLCSYMQKPRAQSIPLPPVGSDTRAAHSRKICRSNLSKSRILGIIV